MLNALGAYHISFSSLLYNATQFDDPVSFIQRISNSKSFCFKPYPSSALQFVLSSSVFASIRSPLSSAEILYFPEKCSPDSGRDYSPFSSFVKFCHSDGDSSFQYIIIQVGTILTHTESKQKCVKSLLFNLQNFSENIFVFLCKSLKTVTRNIPSSTARNNTIFSEYWANKTASVCSAEMYRIKLHLQFHLRSSFEWVRPATKSGTAHRQKALSLDEIWTEHSVIYTSTCFTYITYKIQIGYKIELLLNSMPLIFFPVFFSVPPYQIPLIFFCFI